MRFLILTILLTIGFSSYSQEERRHVRKGIEYLQKEEFGRAEEAFRDALKIKPNSFEAGYNLATTLFRQERFDDAIAQFQAIAPLADTKEKQAMVYHNLGNSFLNGQQLDNSIESYKRSLRLNPLDDQTRYNLIAAMKLKDQQDDQQEQEQEQQEQEQQEQEQQEQEQEQEQDQQEQQQQEQQEGEGINREDAERLLQAIEQDEKELMDKMNQHREQQPVRIDKNW
jgi:Ca-activated chloride channel homolog